MSGRDCGYMSDRHEPERPSPCAKQRLGHDPTPVELPGGDFGPAGVSARIERHPTRIAARMGASTGRPVHMVSRVRTGARTHEVLLHGSAADPGRPLVAPCGPVVLGGTDGMIHPTRTRHLAEDMPAKFARLHRLDAPLVTRSLPKSGATPAVPRGVVDVLAPAVTAVIVPIPPMDDAECSDRPIAGRAP